MYISLKAQLHLLTLDGRHLVSSYEFVEPAWLEFEVLRLGNDDCVGESCDKTGDVDFDGGVGGNEDGIIESENVSYVLGDGAVVNEDCNELLSTVSADKHLLSCCWSLTSFTISDF